MKRLHRLAGGLCCLAIAAMAGLTGCNNSSHVDQPTKPDTAPHDAAQPGGKKLKQVVLLINNSSSYWDAARAGMQAAAEKLKLADAGLEAVFEPNDGTTQGQLEHLRDLGTRSDVVGIAVSAVTANNLAVVEELRKLRKQGIHIICMDADVDRAKYRDAREYYVGTDNIQAGRALGMAARQLLADRKVDKGGYVQFVGYIGAQNAKDRMDGFKEKIGSQYTELGRMQDNTDPSLAQTSVREAITNHADLVALIGIWSYNAPAIASVVEHDFAAKRKNLTIATFDAEPGAIQGMSKGWIDLMVVQDPYDIGYQSTRALKALHEDDKATLKEMFPNAGKDGGDLYDTQLKVVVPNEKSPVTAELFKPVFGEHLLFMTLPTFQEWLKKYGLSGS